MAHHTSTSPITVHAPAYWYTGDFAEHLADCELKHFGCGNNSGRQPETSVTTQKTAERANLRGLFIERNLMKTAPGVLSLSNFLSHNNQRYYPIGGFLNLCDDACSFHTP